MGIIYHVYIHGPCGRAQEDGLSTPDCLAPEGDPLDSFSLLRYARWLVGGWLLVWGTISRVVPTASSLVLFGDHNCEIITIAGLASTPLGQNVRKHGSLSRSIGLQTRAFPSRRGWLRQSSCWRHITLLRNTGKVCTAKGGTSNSRCNGAPGHLSGQNQRPTRKRRKRARTSHRMS